MYSQVSPSSFSCHRSRAKAGLRILRATLPVLNTCPSLVNNTWSWTAIRFHFFLFTSFFPGTTPQTGALPTGYKSLN